MTSTQPEQTGRQTGQETGRQTGSDQGRHEPRTDKGTQTRRRLLEAAEKVFADRGYHDASIVKIAEAAGVAGGTFYIYFKGKQDIFDELVIDLNHRVRQAMAEASSQGTSRSDAERRGFEAFFRFTGEHPALYRIIRQAEFVSPRTLRLHYERIVDGYIDGLNRASAAGEIEPLDPEVAAWALMGAGELIGMRYVLWDDQRRIPEHVFEETMRFVRRGLGARDEEEES